MILGVTGHRPRRLSCNKQQFALLDTFAEVALSDYRPEYVVTGMALGWDQSIARACLTNGTPFHAAVPFDGFDEEWSPEQREEFKRLLAAAARVVTLYPPGYDTKKLMGRNKWIVDNTTEMLGLWDGKDDGGTAQCIRYARKQGVLVKNVWLDWRDFVRKPADRWAVA